MNSLTELNGFVNGFTLPYTDQRLPDVQFDRGTPSNQTQSVDRGFTISGSVGIEITEILNAPISNPVYTIDVSNLAGATVSYASLPPGVSLFNPSAGVYIITGFVDKAQWDLIKSPTIDFSDDFIGSFTYTSTISYFSYYTGATTKTWTTAVTVNNILFWTNANQFIYQQSAVTNFSGTPLLGNLDAAYPSATWTVTITPSLTTSINTFTTTGTGGTFSVNASTKVITITGTRAQVNNRLSGLQIDANAVTVDFVLTYFASNSLNAVTDTRTQTLLTQGLAVLGSVSQPTIYYNEDTAFTITGAPQITDTSFDGTGTYTYTITPSDIAAISTATIGGSGGSASFNASTKVITITGTRTQVNGRLGSITITPSTDYALNFNLQYFCSTPRADTANKIQVAAIGSNDTEITNMNISRNFTANNSNNIFSTTTPFISDLDATNPTYTVIFNCPNGQWTGPSSISPYVEGSLSNPLSITGTKAFINARFASIKFYPNYDLSTNTTFTYTQIKNGVTQVLQTVTLIRNAGTYQSRTVDFINSQTWTPTTTDVMYGKINSMLLVGGGGGGAVGGGGGGELKYITTDFIFQNISYNIVVGGGGIAGNSNTNAGNGGDTTAFGYTARGGGGGYGWNNGGYGNGGYSYTSTGAQILGGVGTSHIIYTSAITYRTQISGGGGASGVGLQPNSGERVLTVYPFNTAPFQSYNTINAWINPNNTLYAGSGAIGLATEEFSNISPDWTPFYTRAYSYGFGGGGGYWTDGPYGPRAGLGGYYVIDPNAQTLGQGGAVRGTPPTSAISPNYILNGVRQATVAGGGGGGCPVNNVTPATNGGDGVVRIIITQR